MPCLPTRFERCLSVITAGIPATAGKERTGCGKNVWEPVPIIRPAPVQWKKPCANPAIATWRRRIAAATTIRYIILFCQASSGGDRISKCCKNKLISSSVQIRYQGGFWGFSYQKIIIETIRLYRLAIWMPVMNPSEYPDPGYPYLCKKCHFYCYYDCCCLLLLGSNYSYCKTLTASPKFPGTIFRNIKGQATIYPDYEKNINEFPCINVICFVNYSISA